MDGVNQVFLVNNDFVKVNNSLFPITHRFVVKPSDWVFEGVILECYNCFAALRPGGVSGMNQGGGHRFEITFANTRFTGGGHQLSPAYLVWEAEWAQFVSPPSQGWAWIRDVERNTGTGIGQSANPGYRDIFNQVNPIRLLPNCLYFRVVGAQSIVITSLFLKYASRINEATHSEFDE